MHGRATAAAAILGCLLAAGAGAQARYGHDGKFLLPDPTFTPGAANPLLVADRSGAKHIVEVPWSKKKAEANICAADFRTGPWRNVSEKEKKTACLEYGIRSGCPGPRYELDHLCSLEFGCSDSLLNLWPQPILQARVKDHEVEDKLPKLVCSGKMTLKEAQSCAEHDWINCMETISKLEGSK